METGFAQRNETTLEIARRLLNEAETARYINMSRSFLRKDRAYGTRAGHTAGPPWIRVKNAIRYDIHDLDAWIAANREFPKQAA